MSDADGVDLAALAQTAAAGDKIAARTLLDAIQDDVYELTLRMLVNYRDYHALTRAGGWQMRVALGKLLVQRPDVLPVDDLGLRKGMQMFPPDLPLMRSGAGKPLMTDSCECER